MTTNNKEPIHKLVIDGVSLAIWQRPNASTAFKIDVTREKKVAEGQWESTKEFTPYQAHVRETLQEYALGWLLQFHRERVNTE